MHKTTKWIVKTGEQKPRTLAKQLRDKQKTQEQQQNEGLGRCEMEIQNEALKEASIYDKWQNAINNEN